MRLLIAIIFIFNLMAIIPPASAATCKSYRKCEQAVKEWCAGRHPGADRDGDGIPCENVCPTLSKVKKIKKRIGC